jgi:hypothetical protein
MVYSTVGLALLYLFFNGPIFGILDLAISWKLGYGTNHHHHLSRNDSIHIQSSYSILDITNFLIHNTTEASRFHWFLFRYRLFSYCAGLL